MLYSTQLGGNPFVGNNNLPLFGYIGTMVGKAYRFASWEDTLFMSEWFEQSFGNDYLIVYKHRDLQGAYEEVRRMVGWLQLAEGAHILDLCCGMGRHALALHDFGYQVTGVDLSEVLLHEAHKLDARNKVKWIRGDMRQVPLQDQFDAVVNLFTSFGYFSEDDDNLKVLQEIRRLLQPSGKFIIDYLNPSYVIKHIVPHSQRVEGAMTIEENRTIEDGFVKKQIVIREAGGPDRHYAEQVKLYPAEQLRALVEKAGLCIDQVYGNYDEQQFQAEASPRLILVGHKEA